MKADVWQQHSLLELVELDAELNRIAHRAANLSEQQRCEQLEAGHRTAVDGLAEELTAARQARDAALAEIEQTRGDRVTRRAQVSETVAPELASLYERVGAGALQGRRCGACRIEIDRGELSRIAAAAEDDVLRCPECGAILLRVTGVGA